MLTGTRTLARELQTYTQEWDGEEVLLYRMNRIVVDGIRSEFYAHDGSGQVHFAPMISWKHVDRSTGDAWACLHSSGEVYEEAWLRFGLVLTEEEYKEGTPDYWAIISGIG